MAMAMVVSLPALAAGPQYITGRNTPGAVLSLREGIPAGCKLRTTDWGSLHGASQFRRTRRLGLVSCSMAPAKEEGVPELTAQKTAVSPFNVLITGSTKGKGNAAFGRPINVCSEFV